MNLDLDKTQLEERRVWMEKIFNEQVTRIRYMLNHFVETDLEGALKYISYDRDKIMGTRGHSAAAGRIAKDLAYAVANCDLSGLVSAAADLDVTLQALGALEALRETLPSDVVEAWEAAELAGKSDRDAKTAEQRAILDAKKASMCQASVPMGGRAVGFRQCVRPQAGDATFEHNGQRYRACATHKNPDEHARPYKEAS